VTSDVIVVPYRTADGGKAERSFTVYRTHHGPIIREAGGKWISIALMNKPVAALEQSFLRTKATDYASFMKVAELKANSSNNTIFADSKGEIAYLHPQFIPKRDDRFDYTKPVDGADPATDWKGLHALNEAPHLLNPPKRLDLQHQRLALFGGRPLQPQEGGLSQVHGHVRREPARDPRHPGVDRPQGLHPARPAGRWPSIPTCRPSRA
jgi:hypothetical protein